jgi:hypothetical protein
MQLFFAEVVTDGKVIPQKVADRLQEYAAKRCQTSEDRIFPFSYEEDTARMMAAKAG